MEGTFLATYDNKIKYFENLINETEDLQKKKKIQTELTDYMLQCVPYITRYIVDESAQNDEIVDPIFNTVTTRGIRRREIYEDYQRNVENYNGSFNRPQKGQNRKFRDTFRENKCSSCNSKNVFQDSVESNYVCMDCGICEHYLGEELTYKEEQEVAEKTVVNCGYKKENH